MCVSSYVSSIIQTTSIPTAVLRSVFIHTYSSTKISFWKSWTLQIFTMQVGGFVLPLLVFGGISLFLTLLLLVNVHPTGASRFHIHHSNVSNCREKGTIIFLCYEFVLWYQILFPTECTSAKVPWRIVFKMFKSVWFVLIGKSNSTNTKLEYVIPLYLGQVGSILLLKCLQVHVFVMASI